MRFVLGDVTIRNVFVAVDPSGKNNLSALNFLGFKLGTFLPTPVVVVKVLQFLPGGILPVIVILKFLQ